MQEQQHEVIVTKPIERDNVSKESINTVCKYIMNTALNYYQLTATKSSEFQSTERDDNCFSDTTNLCARSLSYTKELSEI